MDPLMLRRRAMMAVKGAESAEYIQDGLVLWLDGLSVDSNSLWVDRAGNRDFALYNCVKQNNGVLFNGTSSYGRCNTADISNGETIEAVFSYATGETQCIFAQRSTRTNPYVILRRNANGVIYTFATDTNVAQLTAPQQPVETISALRDASRGLLNGQQVSTNGQGNKAQAEITGILYIGREATGSNLRYLNGVLYGIRIYNRQLTTEEMLHNQHIDNARYNLGVFS